MQHDEWAKYAKSVPTRFVCNAIYNFFKASKHNHKIDFGFNYA